jgi:hypothetical protein
MLVGYATAGIGAPVPVGVDENVHAESTVHTKMYMARFFIEKRFSK